MHKREHDILDDIAEETDKRVAMHYELRRKAKENARAEEEAIVPVATTGIVGIAKPVASIAEVVDAWRTFQDLKSKLLDDNDYLVIQRRDGPERYIVKSGWRKLAAAFGLVDSIIGEERELGDDGHMIYRVTVRVTHPQTGRFTEAVGSASSRERAFQHPDHDLRSLAHTRAKSRGISDLIGGGGDVGDDVPAPAVDVPSVPTQTAEKTAASAPVEYPLTIPCPKCRKPVPRKFQIRTKSYFYACDNHVPHLIWDKDGNEWGVERKT